METKDIFRAARILKKWMDNEVRDNLQNATINIDSQIMTIEKELARVKRFCDYRLLITEKRPIPKRPLSVLDGAIVEILRGIDIQRHCAISWCEQKEQDIDSSVTIKAIAEEIRIISEAWPGTKIERTCLLVPIRNVFLEDDVGSFTFDELVINIDLENPLGEILVSGEENNDGYVHPHADKVNNLCLGDGEPAITQATCEGRLEDVIRILEVLLKTYNESSTHCELNKFYDPYEEMTAVCDNCTEYFNVSDTHSCERCNYLCCSSCANSGNSIGSCDGCHISVCLECCCGFGCGCTYCLDCASQCGYCGDPICTECSSCCEKDCGSLLCDNCTVERANCHKTICNNHTTMCDVCLEHCCDDCANDCSRCDHHMCRYCEFWCLECKSNTCEDCKNECESCGVEMCKQCLGEHNCIFNQEKPVYGHANTE